MTTEFFVIWFRSDDYAFPNSVHMLAFQKIQRFQSMVTRGFAFHRLNLSMPFKSKVDFIRINGRVFGFGPRKAMRVKTG